MPNGLRREPTNSAMHPAVEAKLRELARKYGVSRSWVIATLVAEQLHVGSSLQEPYYAAGGRAKLRRVK